MRALSGRSLLMGTSLLALPMLAAPAMAQQAGGLEEIIVTAQKRAERLQETPVSVSAITAEALEQRGVVDARNLNTLAANVTTEASPSSTNTLGIFIRGLGDGEPILTVDAPIGLYVDGVPIGRTTGAIFDMVDLARIEVLRGPQGTLYGRNTTGGAVNFITAQPSDEFGAEQKFGYGNFAAFQSRTRIDTGRIGDTGLKAKLAFVHKDRNGYVDNILQPDRGKDPGADHVNAFRGVIAYDQGGPVTGSYSYENSVEKGNAMAFQLTAVSPLQAAYFGLSPVFGGSTMVIGGDRRLSQIALENDGPITTRIQGHNLTLNAELAEDMTLKSMTGFRRWDDINTGTDLDGNGVMKGLVTDGVNASVGNVTLFKARNNRHQHQISEEVNLGGKAFDKLEYVLGGFYFHEKSRELNPQELTFLTAIPGGITLAPGLTTPAIGFNVVSPLQYTHFSTSKALFGQGTYHLTEKIDLTAGVRYTHDNRHLVQQSTIVRDVAAAFSRVNWSASAAYKIDQDIMVFTRVATGYKAGGFNARSAGAPFQPEKVISYEGGVKSELFDRKLRFNASYYYTNATNLQIQQFAAGSGGATSVTVNAGKSHIQGIDAEMQALLGMGLSVDGNFGLADRKYITYNVLDPSTNTIINIANLIKGGGSAKYTANVGLQYDFPEMPVGQLTARLDYNYRSKVRWHPSTFSTPYNEIIAGPGIGLITPACSWRRSSWALPRR
jgi:iron complex outermembrane receptor protein